jgi:glucose/arabinose dehydrogenase
MRKQLTTLAAGILIVIVTGSHAHGEVSTVRIATGLSRPVYATHAPGDTERLFIVEQHVGRIRILDLSSGAINAQPFLDIDGLSTGNEQGLLGLAFDPDYDTNGYFYVNVTPTGSGTHIRRFQVSGDPDIADPLSQTEVLSFSQPQSNHNGGWMGFGPDGYLYISSGDGGGSDDNDAGHTLETGNAQDITDNLLGKMLRIDVGGDDFPGDAGRNYAIPADNPFVGVTGDDEIWSYGLRNPWRPSFDRQTGDLWIADVGQNTREEVDYQSAASAGGENYGWRLREGSIQTPAASSGGPAPPGAIEPIYEYEHGIGPGEGYSLTGGYVYRGPVGEIRGNYFFADYVSEQIWSMRYDGETVTDFTDWTTEFTPDAGEIDNISSFGEDAVGNLYILDLGGEVFRVTGPVPGDANGDGAVTDADYTIWADHYGQSGADASTGDFNGDGSVTDADYTIWADNYGIPSVGVPEPAAMVIVALGFVGVLWRQRGSRT